MAAFGVIMYISFVYESAYLGYAQGIAPVISFNYGAQNRKELHNVFTKSLVFYGMTGLVVTLASLAFASPLAWLFTGYNQSLYTLTIHGLRLYALSFTISAHLCGLFFYCAQQWAGSGCHLCLSVHSI